MKRNISASGAVAITRSSIKMVNGGEADVNSFKLMFHPSEATGSRNLCVTLSPNSVSIARTWNP